MSDRIWWFIGIGAAVVAVICAVLAVGVGYLYLTNRTEVAATRPGIVVPTPQTTALPTLPPNLAPTATLGNGGAAAATVSNPAANLPVLSGTAAVAVARASSAVQIDGVLDEWGAVPAIPLDYRVYTRPTWDGSDDLTAAYRLLWDDSYLYVAVEIQDDTHVQSETGRTSFRGDSLEMQFDTDRPGDYGRSLSPDDYQLVLSPGDFGSLPAEAYRFRGTLDGQMDDFVGQRISVAAVQTADGYTLEARIPWADLGLTPQAGLEIGACLNANDNDQGDPAGQEMMLSNVSTRTFRDPTTWGTLVLR